MGLSRATGSSWPSSTQPWAAAGRSWGDRGRCIRAEYGPARLQGLKVVLPPGSRVGLGAAQPFCTPVSLHEKWGGSGPAASSGDVSILVPGPGKIPGCAHPSPPCPRSIGSTPMSLARPRRPQKGR